MTRYAALLILLLFNGVAQSVQAQTYKLGDNVEALVGTTCLPCTVDRPLEANAYGVACGPTDYTAIAGPQWIRPHQPTIDQQMTAFETAAALLLLPRPATR